MTEPTSSETRSAGDSLFVSGADSLKPLQTLKQVVEPVIFTERVNDLLNQIKAAADELRERLRDWSERFSETKSAEPMAVVEQRAEISIDPVTGNLKPKRSRVMFRDLVEWLSENEYHVFGVLVVASATALLVGPGSPLGSSVMAMSGVYTTFWGGVRIGRAIQYRIMDRQIRNAVEDLRRRDSDSDEG